MRQALSVEQWHRFGVFAVSMCGVYLLVFVALAIAYPAHIGAFLVVASVSAACMIACLWRLASLDGVAMARPAPALLRYVRWGLDMGCTLLLLVVAVVVTGFTLGSVAFVGYKVFWAWMSVGV